MPERSILLTAATIGRPVSRISAIASRSPGPRPARPSSMKTTTSASATACKAPSATRSPRRSRPPNSRPPLSTTKKLRPRCSAWPTLRSRVVPAMGLTIARRPRAIRLKRVDLPALARPTSTATGVPSGSAVSAPARAARFATDFISEAQLRNLARTARPVLFHLDQQLQEDPRAEHLFEFDARGRADLFELAAARPD